MSPKLLQWMAVDLTPELTPEAKIRASAAILESTLQICAGTTIR
jgi:hypothetical protein